MRAHISIIMACAVLFSCTKPDVAPDDTTARSVEIVATSLAGHDCIVATPDSYAGNVVILLAETLDVKSAAAVPEINRKVREQCLLGGYKLCIVAVGPSDDVSCLKDIKSGFADGRKFYLLGYLSGGSHAYAAAMNYPEEFDAFGSVNGPIRYADYEKTGFSAPVAFVHVQGTDNGTYLWNGRDKDYAAAELSAGAAVAACRCTHYETGSYLARSGYEKVSYTHYIGSSSGKDVLFCRVPGGKNDWCDSSFEVYNVIWQFFAKH